MNLQFPRNYVLFFSLFVVFPRCSWSGHGFSWFYNFSWSGHCCSWFVLVFVQWFGAPDHENQENHECLVLRISVNIMFFIVFQCCHALGIVVDCFGWFVLFLFNGLELLTMKTIVEAKEKHDFVGFASINSQNSYN